MEWYLPVIWAALIGTAVVLYVILDGFDLGIGILVPVCPQRNRARPDDAIGRAVLGRQRNLACARRRWVVGGISKAYAVVMPALYLPVIVMLLSLVFRGVAFEFRARIAQQNLAERGFRGRLNACCISRESSSEG